MSYPIFDMHCDTADRLAWQFLPGNIKQTCGMDFYGPGDADDPSACRDLASNHCHISLDKIGSMPWAQCFACYVPDALSPEQATGFHGSVMSHLAHEVERNAGRVTPVASASQLRGALEGGGEPHVAAVHTIENARMFAANLGLVERYAADGLLMASLTWNAAGPLASGNDTHEGLTSLGREALAEMARHSITVDVSHLNDESFADIARATDEPLVASHSNSRAVCNHPRNLTDAEFAEICARGGVVGLNYCSYFLVEGAKGETGKSITFDQVATHIEHWLDLGGENAIALGGDLDGADVPDLLDGADKMPVFHDLLEKRFGEDVTAKLCYGNALNFFERYHG